MSLQRVDSMFDIEWADGREVRRRPAARRNRTVEVRLRPGGHAAGGVRRVPSRPVRQVLQVCRAAARRAGSSGRRSSTVSSARTSSTSSTRATASASPSGPPTSCGCGSSPSASRRPTWRDRRPPPRRLRRRRALMDRELLLEIGCEELPASWLPGLTAQIGEVVDRAAQSAASRAGNAGRNLQHAAPPDRAHRHVSPSGRPTSKSWSTVRRSRPASGRTARRRRPRSASRPRTAPRSSALERVETPKGIYLAFRKKQRGKAAVDVLPDVLRRNAARADVSQS